MAIVALVLWMFTAGAGFYVLITSSLGRSGRVRPSAPSLQPDPGLQPAPSPQPAVVTQPAAATPAAARAAQAAPTPREVRRAARGRWDPPSLVASRQAPIVPGARSLVEFAHPALGITGLGFWLGFTLVHNRALGWIGFGVAVATACVGLGWFTANIRAARRAHPGPRKRSVPSFVGRLVALHGSGAAVTVALTALAALVVRG